MSARHPGFCSLCDKHLFRPEVPLFDSRKNGTVHRSCWEQLVSGGRCDDGSLVHDFKGEPSTCSACGLMLITS